MRDLHFYDHLFFHFYSLEEKRSISRGKDGVAVVESKVNASPEEAHTIVRAILSLRGNDNTWLHTLLHADTSVPLLLGTLIYFLRVCSNQYRERT